MIVTDTQTSMRAGMADSTRHHVNVVQGKADLWVEVALLKSSLMTATLNVMLLVDLCAEFSPLQPLLVGC